MPEENTDRKNSKHGHFLHNEYVSNKNFAKAIILQRLLFKIIHVTCNELVIVYFTKDAV